MMDSCLTPMVRQYLSLKDKYKDCLLFFRLGDFYELFYEDAQVASSVLEIVLTKRGKDDDAMPMCGIPFHSAENYIARLIRQGFKVAICEQLETPQEAKKRGYKAIVQRDVVRIITPGTLIEENFLDSDQNNFLVALYPSKKYMGIAAIDISTGEFLVEETLLTNLESSLSRFSPKEILVSEKTLQISSLYDCFQIYKNKITRQSESRFDCENGEDRLCRFFKTASLLSFGNFSESEVSAAGAALEYIYLTQKEALPRLNRPKKLCDQDFLQIDATTRRSLELTSTLNGDNEGSFFSTIDQTLTPGGKRLLFQAVSFPFVSIDPINKRLDQTEWLIKNKNIREPLRSLLKNFPDGERVLARLFSNRGGPRDLLAIKNLLNTAELLLDKFKNQETPFSLPMNSFLSTQPLKEKLNRAIKESPPFLAREGGFILPGYLQELDELRLFRDEGQKMMASLQAKYCKETNIPTLKIKYNNVLGYYIEITSLHKEKIPETFIHRQTLSNNMRFSTPELIEIQEKIMKASDKTVELELNLFNDLVEGIRKETPDLCQVIEFVSLVDLIFSFSTLAITHKYTRPIIRTDPLLLIEKGRHPSIESLLKEKNTPFIPNDCVMDKNKNVLLLTGPNMAGKSTYLRQNALIIILAQMGCYVPAEKAEIGIVDRLFSRVGAGDDLTKGKSTFMMEMIETASILNQATERSFVILDEIGRGTSTYDGLSIAQATAEHLHNHIKCRTVFATHYHEMTALEDCLEKLKCYAVAVKEWQETIVFLHTLIEGKANQSYGIHVASLAGMPASVVHRAQDILKSLESTPPLRKEGPFPNEDSKEKSVLSFLASLDPNQISPKEALDTLYKLKEKVRDLCQP